MMAKRIDRLWYGNDPVAVLLIPLSLVYRLVIGLRRVLYHRGVLRRFRPPCPVIVIGNISVGGTGKTPLVIWVVEWLQRHGYRPGVISRGYGGKSARWPQRVTRESDPAAIGDEPFLIHERTGCPVVVDPVRARAASDLLAHGACDMIVADDGLQHYALERDIEVAVIDGMRRFGNGRCLPAGPLRESRRRLRDVDLIVCNGAARGVEMSMQLRGDVAVNLADGSRRSLDAFSGQPLHAVAGIGNPERFFDHLRRAGLRFDVRVFADHHSYRVDDIVFADDAPVLMTEKDAVKCRAFANARHWSVPVSAQLDGRFGDRLLALLKDRNSGQKTA